MNTVRAYPLFLAPTTLPFDGAGGRGVLILSQISADVVENQNNQYEAQAQNCSAALLSL
jgi:hypothetical protein